MTRAEQGPSAYLLLDFQDLFIQNIWNLDLQIKYIWAALVANVQ